MSYIMPGFFLFTILFWVYIAWLSERRIYVKIIFTIISLPVFFAILNQANHLL